MNFNFYEEFQNHSNEELIAIVRQTDAYQPEAVAAAYQHLNERQVSKNEILGIKEISTNNYTVGASEDGQEDLLVPYIHEIIPTTINKWITALLSVIAFRFLAGVGSVLFFHFRTNGRYFYFLEIFSIDNLIIFFGLPILFLLILKRKKWGWFILFSFSLLNAFSFIGVQGAQLANGYVHNLNSLWIPSIYFSIEVFSILALWKNEVASFYSISKTTKQKTALIVSILAIVFLMAMQ